MGIVKEWLSPNGITAIATVITCIAAILALNTWKKQIYGETNYELEKRIKKGIKGLEMIISRYRLLPPMYVENNTNNQTEFEFLSSSYNEINKIIDELTLSIEAALIEAEALWGKGYTNFVVYLKLDIIEYKKAIKVYLASKNNEEIVSDMSFDKAEQILGYKEGEFSKKFEDGFKRTVDIIYSIDK